MTEELDADEFEKWILEEGIGENDIRIPLLKKAWNRSLHLACNLFGENEGVDFGAEEKYFAY